MLFVGAQEKFREAYLNTETGSATDALNRHLATKEAGTQAVGDVSNVGHICVHTILVPVYFRQCRQLRPIVFSTGASLVCRTYLRMVYATRRTCSGRPNEHIRRMRNWPL